MIILQGITAEEFFEKIEEIVERKINEKIKVDKKERFTYLTRNEVASLLKISLPTLHEWTKEGLIVSYRIGSRVYYKSNEVELSVVQRKFMRQQFYR